MATIELTQGQVTVVDDADLPLLIGYRWIAQKRVNAGVVTYYAAASVKTDRGWRLLLLHRLLMGEPKGIIIDHRNGNSLDNRRENLRPCSNGQNRANSKKHKVGLSKYKGVTLDRGKVTAQIRHEGRLRNLGKFETEEAAARAYDREARRLHGEFARTNFPEETNGQSA